MFEESYSEATIDVEETTFDDIVADLDFDINEVNESNGSPRRSPSLFVDVPIEHRIAYLDVNIEIGEEWESTKEIARLIGASESWTIRALRKLGIQPEMRQPARSNGQGLCYPPIVLALLREERQWQEEFWKLKPYVTVNELAAFSGRNKAAVRKILIADNVKRRVIPFPNSKRVVYPRSAAKNIRQETLSYLPSNGRVPMRVLKGEAGDGGEIWIRKALIEAGFTSEERRSELHGGVVETWEAEARAFVRQAYLERQKMRAGDWVTRRYISLEIGRTKRWVNSRIAKYAEYKETKLDDIGRERDHYPYFVLEALRVMSERELSVDSDKIAVDALTANIAA